MNPSARYHKGLAAEDSVARAYAAGGSQLLHRRWRSAAGEVDLICRSGDVTVFVEVKARGTHAEAAYAISERQAARIMAASQGWLQDNGLPLDSDIRFDVALVDRTGRIEIVENALAA